MVRQGRNHSPLAVSEPTRAVQPVGDHQQFVVAKEGGDLALVGLELRQRAAQGGVLVHRVL